MTWAVKSNQTGTSLRENQLFDTKLKMKMTERQKITTPRRNRTQGYSYDLSCVSTSYRLPRSVLSWTVAED